MTTTIKYFNVADEFLSDVPGSIGQGPFREVRLLIDGQIAGAVFPYPVIFTGGIDPTAWRFVTSDALYFLSTDLVWAGL